MLSSFILKDNEPPQSDFVIAKYGKSDFNRAYKITNELANGTDLDSLLQDNPDFDINSYGRCGCTILSVALTYNKSAKLIKQILDMDNTLVNNCWGDYGSPYFWNAACTNLEIVKEVYFKLLAV